MSNDYDFWGWVFCRCSDKRGQDSFSSFDPGIPKSLMSSTAAANIDQDTYQVNVSQIIANRMWAPKSKNGKVTCFINSYISCDICKKRAGAVPDKHFSCVWVMAKTVQSIEWRLTSQTHILWLHPLCQQADSFQRCMLTLRPPQHDRHFLDNKPQQQTVRIN